MATTETAAFYSIIAFEPIVATIDHIPCSDGVGE